MMQVNQCCLQETLNNWLATKHFVLHTLLKSIGLVAINTFDVAMFPRIYIRGWELMYSNGFIVQL